MTCRYEEVMFGVKKESINTEKKREVKKSDQFAENRKKKDSRYQASWFEFF